MGVVFRGRCGAWVLETPDEEIHDLPAQEAVEKFVSHYGLAEDWGRDPEPEEGMVCIHGVLISGGACQLCYEEYMAQQLAVCRFRDGQTEAEVNQFITGFIDSPLDAKRVAVLVGEVFADVDAFDPYIGV